MRLEPILRPDLTLFITDADGRDDALKQIAEVAARADPALDVPTILSALIAREDDTPTTTPEGVAFPHAMLKNVQETLLIIARLKPAVSFGNADLPHPELVLGMIGSADKPWEHVRLLARLARIVRSPGARDRLLAAQSPDELYERFIEEDRSHG